jgi:hypothetical protein
LENPEFLANFDSLKASTMIDFFPVQCWLNFSLSWFCPMAIQAAMYHLIADSALPNGYSRCDVSSDC